MAQTATLELNALRELVAEIIDVDVEEVTDDARFVEDLEVDSLLALEITVRLEKHYGIKVSEDELSRVTTLRGTYDMLAAKVTT